MAKDKQPLYGRVLLKMSGEALMGCGSDTIDPQTLDRMVSEILEVHALGVQVAIVVGGGNFCRGRALSETGISRITGDYMGMLATLMNALSLRDAFERQEAPVRILSAIPMSGIVDHFNCRKAIHHLNYGRIVIFAGGTGNPLVTTDSAASLRGIEIGADAILKATNVDGIYNKDPAKYDDAVLYKNLEYQEVLEKELAVMDLSAFCQCRDHGMTIRVFNMTEPGSILQVITDKDTGTTVK
jgi:uridylate kinase